MKNDKYIKYFCENIKNLRKSNKLSKAKMAKILSIERRTLSELEKGKIPPQLNVDILASISKNFGVKITNMFSPNYKDDD